jgi:hypothetical protein
MKIYKPVGSKERFAEIFQGVTKTKLNEAFMSDAASLNPENVLNMAFEQLKSGGLKIEQSNSQGSGEQSYVELVCKDKQGNDITFTFKVQSSAGDQDGVYNVNGVMLTNFTFDSPNEEVVELDESGLRRFNAQHGKELFDAIQQYITVEDEEPIDSLYEDAIRKIDSAPFGKDSFDKMQTGKAYVDEKPINPAIRVKAPELDKFVKESENLAEFDKPAMKLKMQPMAAPTAVTEEEEKGKKELGSYPDQLGKKFKPKNQMPKKKKKPQTTIKLSEGMEGDDEYEEIPDLDIPVDKGAKKAAHSDMHRDPSMTKHGSDWAEKPEDWSKHTMPYDTKFDSILAEKGDEPETGDDNVTDTEFMDAERQGLDGSENDVNPETEMGTENDIEAGDETPVHGLDPNPSQMKKDFAGMSHEPESDEIEQIAQDKEETGEVIPGGKGEGKTAIDFDPEQILMGMRVEMEHTDDPMYALEITIDHLTEDPEYYTTQDTPEDSAQANASADANSGEGDDKDMEDILLGFKPHNVGDEVPDTSRKLRMAEPEAEEAPEEPEVEPEKKEDELGESVNKRINNLITEEQIKTARLTLSRNIPTGMSKKDAVQILMNNNLKKIL